MDIPDEKIVHLTLYRCSGCGYTTGNMSHAKAHVKNVAKCIGCVVNSSHEQLVLLKDLVNYKTQPQLVGNCTVNGENNIGVASIGVQNNITINLITPTKNTRTMMMEAFKNPRLLAELKAASADEIPALIFKYTKGSESDGEYVKLEGDKVVEMDVNGREKKLPTSKYIKKVIGDAVYTTRTHANQIKPREEYNQYEASHVRMARINVDDFNSAETPGHKKKEKVKVTDVLDKYSAGDHVVYKYPAETKKIIDDTVDNISNEINELNQVK